VITTDQTQVGVHPRHRSRPLARKGSSRTGNRVVRSTSSATLRERVDSAGGAARWWVAITMRSAPRASDAREISVAGSPLRTSAVQRTHSRPAWHRNPSNRRRLRFSSHSSWCGQSTGPYPKSFKCRSSPTTLRSTNSAPACLASAFAAITARRDPAVESTGTTMVFILNGADGRTGRALSGPRRVTVLLIISFMFTIYGQPFGRAPPKLSSCRQILLTDSRNTSVSQGPWAASRRSLW